MEDMTADGCLSKSHMRYRVAIKVLSICLPYQVKRPILSLEIHTWKTSQCLAVFFPYKLSQAVHKDGCLLKSHVRYCVAIKVLSICLPYQVKRWKYTPGRRPTVLQIEPSSAGLCSCVVMSPCRHLLTHRFTCCVLITRCTSYLLQKSTFSIS